MSNTSMHTSALSAQFTGTVVEPAQCRTAIIDHDGHAVPILRVLIELDNGLHSRLHAEQAWPAGQQDQCQAAARRHKKGDRIRVHVPVTSLELVARYASIITALPATEPDAAQPVTAELFA